VLETPNQWLFFAFLAPIFWAFVNIIDVYFVDRVYKDELDGVIISGLVQIAFLPFFLFFSNFKIIDFINFKLAEGLVNVLALSFVGGFIYMLAIYFYFKSLFNKNDVTILQFLLWSSNIIVVPVLSFFLLGEILQPYKYIGLMIVLIGAIVPLFHSKITEKFSRKYIYSVLGATIFLSLSMIIGKNTYDLLSIAYGNKGFWIGMVFFSFGAFVAGTLFAISSKRSPWPLIRIYYKPFISIETIYYLGNVFSQQALNIAPSASYVAAVDAFVPVFILVYSIVILLLSSILKINNRAIQKIYTDQITGFWVKVLATIIMVIGILLFAE